MIKNLILIVSILFFLCSCALDRSLPNVINNFDADRYLGEWYEIARYDHSFERGLINVKAVYSKETDKVIKVINEGFNPNKNKWKKVEGVAYLNDNSNIGHLRVSFFRPFYGDYRILYIDEKYETAIVGGGNYKYLWILSKKKNITDKYLDELLFMIEEFGYNKEKLIYSLKVS